MFVRTIAAQAGQKGGDVVVSGFWTPVGLEKLRAETRMSHVSGSSYDGLWGRSKTPTGADCLVFTAWGSEWEGDQWSRRGRFAREPRQWTGSDEQWLSRPPDIPSKPIKECMALEQNGGLELQGL